MSEELAASIGDVLAENARLKVYLAQVTERALAAEAELKRERDGATMAGVLHAMILELNAAKQDAVAWRQATERLERQRDKTAAVNRELNAQLMEAARRYIQPWLAMLKDADDTANQLVSIALAHHANHQATLDTARRLVAAWRAERARSQALADALQGLLDEPYGCPLCDAGRVLNPAKGHWPDCPYEIARVVLAELREA